jgi:hypothetical protein
MKQTFPMAGHLVVLLLSLLVLSCNEGKGPVTPDTTPPQVSITAPTNGATVSGTVVVAVSATDNFRVARVTLLVDGVLASTDETPPFAFEWAASSAAPGTHTLRAQATDPAGNVGNSPVVTVTVEDHSFTVTFLNPIFTDIRITVGSVTKIAAVGDSAVFMLPANPGTLSYSAQTSGTTTAGTVVGKTLRWGESGIDVSELTSERFSLIVDSSYFFVYLTNSGTKTLSPIYGNYGLADQMMDNIMIPPDNVKYRLGYYEAHTNTQVRAYWQGTTSYTQWTQGTHFTLPFASNQQVSLLNNSLATGGNDDGPGAMVTRAGEYLVPEPRVSRPSMRQGKAQYASGARDR